MVLVLRLAVTAALAALSYRYIESPCRKGFIGRTFVPWLYSLAGWMRLLLISTFAAVIAVVVIGLLRLPPEVVDAKWTAQVRSFHVEFPGAVALRPL